ncbi:serine/threonine-protein kinase pelle [Agrilus planipennis]|uniref:non-specific serine/threonine protein kinase n=1 Tax=Agrilus planipennis TaxID=224129 RepID=A0A1W4XRD3_AGRPL|nr:serine/threonine-protein kinase pelle [Agrilus planipennis]
MYIYQLPHLERRELCRILDQNKTWEELAVSHMKYDTFTVQDLRRQESRGFSPSDELLTKWGHQNHTVLELFVLLSRMRHYHAMTIIKKYVDQPYHRLIVLKDLTRKFQQCTIENPCVKDAKVPLENFNNMSEKALNITHKNVFNYGIETESQIKILNAAPNDQHQNEVSREDNESINQKVVLKHRLPLARIQTGTSKGLLVSDISYVAETAGAIPQIPYEELQMSTNNWSPTTVLGKGGFGTVFKGTWKYTEVAIKRIEQREDNPESHSEQIKQSITELHCLNAYRHDNILPLYGYSIGGPQPCLVYQFMSGGCLERRLKVKEQEKVLKWRQRLNIAIGTARGLQYLHTIGEKPLIHGDIKSANILLDPCNNAKIGDFGLAREGPHADYTHIKVSRIHGTRPYLPDEFLRAKKFSTKVDTYSFGVVLFEIATSLSAYSNQRQEKFLKDHVVNYEGDILDLKDTRVESGDVCYRSLIDIGKLCVSERPKDRPEMVNVLTQLEGVSVN